MSIKEIAEALNLSKATVSCVLSGQGEKKGFSEKTIKRVNDYAASINYTPNLLARSLSTGSTNTIGLIIPFIGDTFYAQLVQETEMAAAKLGYMLMVCSSEGDVDKEFELIKTLKTKQVDGLIIAPTKISQKGIEYLNQEKFPFVLIDRYYPSLKTNYVVVDNKEASKELVLRIGRMGTKKIALLSADTFLYVMRLRIEGYYEAIDMLHLENDQSLEVVVSRNYYEEGVRQQLDHLFKEVPDVDGFYFSTHYLALEAIRYFRSHQIDYLNKFHMGCFHTTVGLDILAPNMLISEMPIEAIGKTAVEILLDNIKEGDTFEYRGVVLKNILRI